MKWSEPELTPLNMNAEIGGYQNDFDDGNHPPYYGRVPAGPAQAGEQAKAVARNPKPEPSH